MPRRDASAGFRALLAIGTAGLVCVVVSVLPFASSVRAVLLVALIAVAYARLGMFTPSERAAVVSAFRRRRDIHAVTS